MIRQHILLSFALVVTFGALAACNSTDSVKPSTASLFVGPDGAQRITAQGLHELWQGGQVFLVDTRGDTAFKTGHIPGAIVIVPNEVLARVDELPRDKMIVTYCT